MRPLVRRIMPEVPPEHPAMGALLMNISANLLGVGHAATPLGLKAMQELQKLNDEPETATNAMCTFLALNTSSVTLIPATVIAFRANAGSANPTEIVATTLMATLCSTTAALTLDYLFRRRQRR
jgi:spore maturation protein A